MTPTFSLLVLRAKDSEATRDFYQSLGLHFEPEQHGSGPRHYAAQLGAIVLEIYPLKPEQTGPDTSTMLGFEVASLEESLKATNTQSEIKTSGWGRFCTLKDPDGRTIRLNEPTAL